MAPRAPSICDCGDHCWTTLTRGFVALADAEFAAVLGIWSWHAAIDGNRVYARRTHHEFCDGRRRSVSIKMHQMVLPVATFVVDHRNRNGLDNRRDNLRLATIPENAANGISRPGSLSRYRGVSPRRGKWIAVITRGGVQKHLGTFASEYEAAQAYDHAATDVHGGFARLNFVGSAA